MDGWYSRILAAKSPRAALQYGAASDDRGPYQVVEKMSALPEILQKIIVFILIFPERVPDLAQ